MKIFFSVSAGIVLLCILLLATIDLTPYLAPEKSSPKVTQLAERSVSPERNVVEKEQESGQAQKAEESHPDVGSETIVDGKIDSPQKEEHQASMAQSEPVASVALDKTNPVGMDMVDSPLAHGTVAEKGADSSVKSEEKSKESAIDMPIMGRYPMATLGYSVLLDTTSDAGGVQKMLATYRQKGVIAYSVKVDIGGKGQIFRIFAGAFPSIASTETYMNTKGLRDKEVKPTQYAAQIGTYVNADECTTPYQKALTLNLDPYILIGKNNKYFLYVGAFYTKEGAESQCRQMVSAGLSCSAVKRGTIE